MTPMPTWDGFHVHILRYLDDGEEHDVPEIRLGAATLAGLTAEQRAEHIPSGQLRRDDRVD